MLLLIVAAIVLFVAAWIIRDTRPVSGVTFVQPDNLCDAEDGKPAMKILDVRDPVDYIKHHVPGSVNISIGRLPYVYRSQLIPDEPVLILSDSSRQLKKAARLLKRYGFEHLYAAYHHDHGCRGNVCRT